MKYVVYFTIENLMILLYRVMKNDVYFYYKYECM